MFTFVFSEGGFISPTNRPDSIGNGTGLPTTGRSMTNYVDDMSNSLYDIPAYDTESSLVILLD